MTTTTTEILVLTLYPLSTAYRSMLESRLGTTPEYRLVSDLRHGGIKRLIKHLAASRYRRVIVPYEVPEGASVLSIVQLLGAAHKLPRLEVCDPSGEFRHVSLGALLGGAMGLMRATIAGRGARRRLGKGARQALQEERPSRILQPGPHRVLYLKNNLWFGLRAGGSVGHVAGVINGLVELGHEVSFVSPEAPKYLAPVVHPVSVPLFRHYALPAETNLFRLQEASVKSALVAARQSKPSIVYQRLSLGDWSGVEVSRALRLPLVVEYNGSELWVSRNWGGNVRYSEEMEAAEDAMLRRADLVFTISRPLYDELIGRGLDPKRVAWYPNCVDPKVFDPSRMEESNRSKIRTALGAGSGDYVVMFVGTFGLWHGAEVFAQAAVQLAPRAAEIGIRFAFVGDGKTRANCEAIIQASPAAAARTIFTGLVPQHEAPDYLAAADAFVASHVPNADGSKFFGSPTKLFEYMAMERPIVASALDQIGEILADEHTALLVKPGDVGALAVGIARLAQDRTLGRKLAVAARREVLAKYTWKRHVEEIMAALNRSLASNHE